MVKKKGQNINDNLKKKRREKDEKKIVEKARNRNKKWTKHLKQTWVYQKFKKIQRY